jgi:hypothetical protein
MKFGGWQRLTAEYESSLILKRSTGRLRRLKSRESTDRKNNAPTTPAEATMNITTQRSIFRWIHIVVAIPILGYIYSPFEKLPHYAPATRFVFLPVMVLSGLWMWKGHVLRRLISKRSGQQGAGDNP